MFMSEYNQYNYAKGFFPLENEKIPLLLFKNSGLVYEICLRDKMAHDGYPKIIGRVRNQGDGDLVDSTKMSWKIDAEYQNLGIIYKVARLLIKETSVEHNCFEVKILKSNVPSLKLAKKLGFQIYKEDSTTLFLLLKTTK